MELEKACKESCRIVIMMTIISKRTRAGDDERQSYVDLVPVPNPSAMLYLSLNSTKCSILFPEQPTRSDNVCYVLPQKPRGVQLLALSHALTAWATLSSSGVVSTKGDVPHVITGHAVRIAGRQKDVEQSGR